MKSGTLYRRSANLRPLGTGPWVSIQDDDENAALWRQLETEGYTDGAVDALRRAGYQAWKNQVGDIAVAPPKGALPAL